MDRRRMIPFCAAAIIVAQVACAPAKADDRLLTEAVNFTGTLTYLTTKVPGFILVAVRNGEMAFAGFGDIGDKGGKTPDADTMFRIGSISKVFCGEVLASMVLDGKVHFADRLQDRLGYDVALPEPDGHPIRLIDLVTQSSGLPREVPRTDGPPDDPFGTNTREAQIADLKTDPLLFPPGTAALYSNYGFDLLGAALANAGGKPYADLLKERVLDPAGMKDTVFNLRPGDEARAMQGHNFDGSPMPAAHTPTSIECAGGLHTTANDMARWMKWHLDRSATTDRDLRLLDHAAYLYRDGLDGGLRAGRCGTDGCDGPRLGDQHADQQPATDPAENRRLAGQFRLSRDRANARSRGVFCHERIQRRRLSPPRSPRPIR